MDISKGQPLACAADKDFVDDEKLMPLHNACNAAHQVRIDALNANPDYRARRAEILNIAVEQKKPSPAKGAGDGPKND
jgi:hypothetical protein